MDPALLSVLLASALSGMAASSLQQELWWRQDSRWEHTPPSIGAKESAAATILRLYPDGHLKRLTCTVYRKGGAGSLNPGDDQVVYSGSWTLDRGSLALKYRRLSGGLEPVRKESAEAEVIETCVRDATVLRCGRRVYRTPSPVSIDEFERNAIEVR